MDGAQQCTYLLTDLLDWMYLFYLIHVLCATLEYIHFKDVSRHYGEMKQEEGNPSSGGSNREVFEDLLVLTAGMITVGRVFPIHEHLSFPADHSTSAIVTAGIHDELCLHLYHLFRLEWFGLPSGLHCNKT